MKRKRNPLALLCAVLLTIIMIFSVAMATETPQSPNKLPVKMEFRDDGGHAFLPRMELAAPSSTTRVQDPEPSPEQGWAGAIVARLGGDKEDRFSMGALKTITSLTKNGRNLNVNLDGYAGATLRKAVPVAAVLIGLKASPFDQLSIAGHVGAIITQGLPTNLAVGASAELRFQTSRSRARAERQVISSLIKP